MRQMNIPHIIIRRMNDKRKPSLRGPARPAAQRPPQSAALGFNPRALDLRLLLAFDAVMSELHVTRAVRATGLSQPAMSHALARLRNLFGDPLLVRTTRGMKPTPRALELVDPVRKALRQVRKIFGAQSAFDQATSQDAFTIRMGDMNEMLILPSILRGLEQSAPRIALSIRHLPPLETVKALDADEIDFAISAGLAHPKSIRSANLLEDEMVCIMRSDHPASRRPLTLKVFLALKHIKIAQSMADTRFIDDELSRQRLKRDIVLNIPHWLAAPSVVECTDLVTAISRRMARRINERGQFAIRPLPLRGQNLVWRLYWHRRHDEHPAHKWMRELVMHVCAPLDTQRASRK